MKRGHLIHSYEYNLKCLFIVSFPLKYYHIQDCTHSELLLCKTNNMLRVINNMT